MTQLLAAKIHAESADATANKFFVQMMADYSQLENKQYPEDRLPILKKIAGTMDEIIKQYPESNIAVDIASGRPIGNFASTYIRAELQRDEQITGQAQALAKDFQDSMANFTSANSPS